LFLKSLTLKGFKSFADRTSLEFEPGIAVVVGPNGSGKSNVVDAVAWVLGAQGVRSLRGGKMDDVIFAGTPRRPPSAKAEVSLTIDNSERLLPVDWGEVTITRTLTRDGESGYAINGKACRLLDILELLSDTGVGRTQHVIVGQGRLDSILHARPEDRRAVIEEAAGILKHRQRKEKAERRLDATAANMERLTDLVKEVRRHLRPLERQADAARRHGGLADELRAIRLHLAGKEIAGLRQRLESLDSRRAAAAADETASRQRAARQEAAVAQAESALSSLGGDALGDDLARAEALRARAEGLVALLAEKRRGMERQLAALADAGVVENLSAEAARLQGEMERVEAEAGALSGQEGGDGSGVPRPGAVQRAAEARSELAALEPSLARGKAETARLQERRETAGRRRQRLEEEAARSRGEVSGEEPLVEALDAARVAREAAMVDSQAAEAALRAADAAASAWAARAEALDQALGELRAQLAGSGVLEGVDGIAGALVDLVDIDPGAEAAVAAGLGEVLRSVVALHPAAAREALARLRSAGVGGTVLVTGAAVPGPVRTVDLPGGTRPLAACLRGRVEGLDAVLERLVAATAVVDSGWEEALELALAHPGLTVVTLDGDRFDSGGAWRAGSRATGATPAAVEEARARAEAEAGALSEAEATLAATRAALEEARRWEAAGERALESHRARQAVVAEALDRLESERAEAEGEEEALTAQAQELAAQLKAEQVRQDELQAALPELEVAATVEQRAEAVRRDLDVRRAAVDERRDLLSRRLAEIEDRLARHGEARRAAEERRAGVETRANIYAALQRALESRLEEAVAVHERLRDRRREWSESARAAAGQLEALRSERTAAEAAVEEARDRRGRLEIEEAEVRTRLATTEEALQRDLECSPEEALAAPVPEVADGTPPSMRAKEIERELRQMGPINPLAVEEYDALRDRHELLESQLEDVRAARRELLGVIREVDEEITARFASAYTDAEAHFGDLVATLFPGGSGRLRLTDPEDLLNTGIEIEARPSGKSVRRLSLLSGGERSLTALAFLFAVFRARPSPFYLLDEVEAALDDVNLCRFLDLIAAFRDEAQLVVVSHQKRTMEAADCLYGVSMPPGGSSIVVTQRVPAAATAS
jgi:chromosome segregation protein